jgi:hypothetical protein
VTEIEREIAGRQWRLGPYAIVPRAPLEYHRLALWWDLESCRGSACAEASRGYARNMRWAAELAGIFGPGTWLELLKRSGHKNPEAKDR